jgi:peptidoglycan-associated lipoprotein
MQHSNGFEFISVRWGRLAGVLALVAFVLLAGCGKKEQIETDPTTEGAPGFEELDDVEVSEDPFGEGSALDQEGVGADDVISEEVAPAVELEDVFFAFDQFELTAEARAALAQNARLLRDNPGVRIMIEGHCDERGTVQYNLALGEKRARESMRYLVSLGIDADRIDIVSYGKERPFAVGSGEAFWSQNRRAHFVVRGGAR